MRLTEKTANGFAPKYERETKTNYYDLVSKLGKLEDIEEELGINLIILFKAMKDGVYLKDNYHFFKDNGDKWFITEIENEIAYYHNQLDVQQFTKRKDGVFGHDEYCPPEEISKGTGTWRSTYIYPKDYGKTWALTKEELQ